MHDRRILRALAFVISALLLATVALPTAVGAEVLDDHPPLELPSPDRLLLEEDTDKPPPEPITDENWQDPVPDIGFAEEDLAPIPDFDFAELHRSEVFATGVDLMTVDDDPLPAARERHLRVLQLAETLRRDLNTTRATLRRLRPMVREKTRQIRYEKSEEERLILEIDVLREAITEFAIQAFIDEDDVTALLTEPATELLENRVVVDQIREDHFIDITDREDELAEHRELRAILEQERELLYAQIGIAQAHRDLRNSQLADTTVLAERTALGYTTALHDRLPSEIVGTDIPLVTFNAYVIAQRVLEVERPSCGLQWWMLAGIGRIESSHGQFDGAVLDVDGNPDTDIRGPALDGRILSGAEFITQGTEIPEPSDRTEVIEIPVADGAEPAATGPNGANAEAPPAPVIKRLALISDTDDGLFDGDTVYDRAVGPMQFIPQTWRTYGVDTNHDDEKDPDNIYDAALASANYLCVAAGSMASEEGQKRGYFAYNHDDEYTENVLQAGEQYRTRIVLPTWVDPRSITSDLGVFDPPELVDPTPGFVDSLNELFDANARALQFAP